jgi:hypothetical protein
MGVKALQGGHQFAEKYRATSFVFLSNEVVGSESLTFLRSFGPKRDSIVVVESDVEA